MSSVTCGVAAAVLTIWLAAAPRPAGGTAQAISDLVDRVADYAERYREQLQYVLADEVTVQRVRRGGETRERTTRGELFLTWLAPERRWMAVHDVAEVDGVAVADRESLRDLLVAGTVPSVARTVMARNARFNLGGVVRNFNEPTLVLALLDPARRDTIRFRRGTRPSPGEPLVSLAFEERERPTLVQSVRGRPVFARGELTVHAASGRIERARLDLDDDVVAATLVTEFGPEARLGMWVPLSFTERYVAGRDRAEETIDVVSQYTNYRRFEVTGRVK